MHKNYTQKLRSVALVTPVAIRRLTFRRLVQVRVLLAVQAKFLDVFPQRILNKKIFSVLEGIHSVRGRVGERGGLRTQIDGGIGGCGGRRGGLKGPPPHWRREGPTAPPTAFSSSVPRVIRHGTFQKVRDCYVNIARPS